MPPADYVIGTDDVLIVMFRREKDMSAEVVVRPDGKITLPLLNDVQATGLTPDQLRETITEQAGRLVEEPNVTVMVKQINSRKVFITGQVAKPGAYPFGTRMTVLQLIAMAGGLGEFAKGKDILILRENARDGRPSRLAADDVQVQLRRGAEGQEPREQHRAEARRHGDRPVAMDRRLLAGLAFALLVGSVLAAAPVCAQTPPAGRVSKPYQTLFGGNDSRIPSLHALDLNVALDSGLDDGMYALSAPPADGQAAASSGFQQIYIATSELAYRRRGGTVNSELRGLASLPYYSLFPDESLTFAYGGSGIVSLTSRRTTVNAAGNFLHSPYYSSALDPSSGPGIGGGNFGRMSALNPTNEGNASTALVYRLGSRTSTIARLLLLLHGLHDAGAMAQVAQRERVAHAPVFAERDGDGKVRRIAPSTT